jgi:hypothetical protein
MLYGSTPFIPSSSQSGADVDWQAKDVKFIANEDDTINVLSPLFLKDDIIEQSYRLEGNSKITVYFNTRTEQTISKEAFEEVKQFTGVYRLQAESKISYNSMYVDVTDQPKLLTQLLEEAGFALPAEANTAHISVNVRTNATGSASDYVMYAVGITPQIEPTTGDITGTRTQGEINISTRYDLENLEILAVPAVTGGKVRCMVKTYYVPN